MNIKPKLVRGCIAVYFYVLCFTRYILLCIVKLDTVLWGIERTYIAVMLPAGTWCIIPDTYEHMCATLVEIEKETRPLL